MRGKVICCPHELCYGLSPGSWSTWDESRWRRILHPDGLMSMKRKRYTEPQIVFALPTSESPFAVRDKSSPGREDNVRPACAAKLMPPIALTRRVGG